MNNSNKVFGIAVRRRRETLGLSQEELAYQAGLHITYISLIERGLRNVSIKTISLLNSQLLSLAPFPEEHQNILRLRHYS